MDLFKRKPERLVEDITQTTSPKIEDGTCKSFGRPRECCGPADRYMEGCRDFAACAVEARQQWRRKRMAEVPAEIDALAQRKTEQLVDYVNAVATREKAHLARQASFDLEIADLRDTLVVLRAEEAR